MLVPLGATLIDTDAISRALTAAGGAALPALRCEFGDAIFNADGSLDRAAMRSRAFADATVRHRLEAVLHPMIGAEAQRQAEAANSAALVFDVPLLAESQHWRARVHRVLVVDCRIETQIERVVASPGWTREAAAAAIAAQATRRSATRHRRRGDLQRRHQPAGVASAHRSAVAPVEQSRPDDLSCGPLFGPTTARLPWSATNTRSTKASARCCGSNTCSTASAS